MTIPSLPTQVSNVSRRPDRPIDLERTRVVALSRFRGGDDERWSCTLCGEQHPASDSWSLAFDTVRGPRTAVICQGCASDVEHDRIIDLDAQPTDDVPSRR